MFMAAARALAEGVEQADLDQGSLYPSLQRVREVSLRIAVAVARVAFAEDLAGIPEPADLDAVMGEQMYDPAYISYVG